MAFINVNSVGLRLRISWQCPVINFTSKLRISDNWEQCLITNPLVDYRTLLRVKTLRAIWDCRCCEGGFEYSVNPMAPDIQEHGWPSTHPTWLCTQSLTPTCPPTGSRHRLWNCLAVYLAVRPSEFSQPRLGDWHSYFTSCCWFSTYCTHLTCRNFICQHSAIVETTIKQSPLAFILSNWRCWESPVLHQTALFFAP